MCVIIHKPAGIQLGDTHWDVMNTCEDAAIMNSDGFGIQAWKAGKLVANWRSTDQAKIVEVAYHNLVQPELEVVAHWRLATHGIVHEANCHPFPINRKLSFWHNGILGGYGSSVKGNEKSDTLDFVERVLRPEFGWWRRQPVTYHHQLLAKHVPGQRFVITSLPTGQVWRYGSWEERGGVWYSNDWLLRGYKEWAGQWECMWEDEYAAGYMADSHELVDYIYAPETEEYLPVKSIRCECYGDICGAEHDLDAGCNRRGEYEVTVTGWHGDKYRSYCCAECAWLGGVEGVLVDPMTSVKKMEVSV